jgi:hypothetical protein
MTDSTGATAGNSRRRFIKGAGVTEAGAAVGAMAMPNVSRAQTAVLKM